MAFSVADAIIQRLQQYGIRHIFGYPGGQITPLYDALARQPGIRHVLARDEQAAAFMADGYARSTGWPGVCLAVCGPGVLNAATPLATAFTDSIPVLLISGQVYSKGLGLRSGYYHENDQLDACRTLTIRQFRVENPELIIQQTDEALAAIGSGRPGPALLEIPVDVLRADCPLRCLPPLPEPPPPLPAAASEIEALVKQVAGWQRPLILAGGGVIAAGAERRLVQLAERLGAPVFHTLAGKAAFPGDHHLSAGLPWHRATSDLSNMASCFSPLFGRADGLMAIGCRFSQAATGSWALRPPAALAQIDIDRAEIGRHYPVQASVHADANEALGALLATLPPADPRVPWADARMPHERWQLPGPDLVGPLRRGLPRDALIVADITRLSYILLAEFPVYERRSFLHPAGFVPMAYGIPAAIGAKAAFPERTACAVVGDGCFLMSGMELATAVQEDLPIIVVLINDRTLSLIKAIQERRYEGRYLGVDLQNPDFQLLAQAFGVRAWQVDSESAFEVALREAVACGETALVEVTCSASR